MNLLDMKFLVLLKVFTVAVALSNFNCFSSTEDLEMNGRHPNYCYSPIHLQYLTDLEKQLFLIIKEYITKLDNEPEFYFKRYIADYEESSLLAFNDWNKSHAKTDFTIYTNPLWSYRMIWRFVTDLPKIKNVLFSSKDSGFEKTIPPSFVWPTERDLNNSMDSLLDLHFVYDLNLTDFANGIIVNVITNANLAAIHCFDIAQYALRNNEQYTLAVEWLEIADIKRVDVSGHPILDYLEATAISELLEDIIKGHDTAWNETDDTFRWNQFMKKMSSNYSWTTQKFVSQRLHVGKGNATPQYSSNDFTGFPALCKGGNLQSEKEKSQLYCWYESAINPAWYINPQKMELHSNDPYIFQVYDFIGDDLINYLKTEAIPMISRAKVNCKDPGSTPNTGNYWKERTSMVSWLFDYLYEPRLPALSQRIGYLTGLRSWGNRSELQIAIYATGGHFGLHLDPDGKGYDGDVGNRLATFMLYLNNVELGGNTAFTSAGVAVTPVKGSAVFWYDLKQNGEVDYRALHGGCPVLLGEKWVASKWIHSNCNMFKRKCTLNKDE